MCPGYPLSCQPPGQSPPGGSGRTSQTVHAVPVCAALPRAGSARRRSAQHHRRLRRSPSFMPLVRFSPGTPLTGVMSAGGRSGLASGTGPAGQAGLAGQSSGAVGWASRWPAVGEANRARRQGHDVASAQRGGGSPAQAGDSAVSGPLRAASPWSRPAFACGVLGTSSPLRAVGWGEDAVSGEVL
jgi:hypothetical protein